MVGQFFFFFCPPNFPFPFNFYFPAYQGYLKTGFYQLYRRKKFLSSWNRKLIYSCDCICIIQQLQIYPATIPHSSPSLIKPGFYPWIAELVIKNSSISIKGRERKKSFFNESDFPNPPPPTKNPPYPVLPPYPPPEPHWAVPPPTPALDDPPTPQKTSAIKANKEALLKKIGREEREDSKQAG